MTLVRVEASTEVDVRRVVGELFVAYLRFYSREDDDLARRFLARRLALGDSLVWADVSDAGVTGFVQVYPEHSSLSLRTVWWLNDLYVDPATRLRGTGRALVQHVLDEAAQDDVASVRLETQATNAGARALYERAGFVLDDPVDRESQDNEFVVYSRRVGER
jgi:ribosomal protein S18 acetylase RimI-like enzyme